MDFTAHTDHTGFEKKLQEDVDYDSTGVPLCPATGTTIWS